MDLNEMLRVRQMLGHGRTD